MKWFVFGLLALNVLIFVLGLIRPAPEAPKVSLASLPVDVSVVQLVGEDGFDRPIEVDEIEPGKAVCTLLGPFEEGADADTLQQRLAILGVRSQSLMLKLPSGVVYWVHLPPLPSREAARRRLAELQANDIDSYIIPKGELLNGISLGVFTQKRLAEERLAVLLGGGVEAQISEIQRSAEQLWLVLEPSERRKIGPDTIQKFISQGFVSQERQNFCLDVASASNFQ